MDKNAARLSSDFNAKYVYLLLLVISISITNPYVAACKDNLDSFINMDPSTGLGTVMSLKQLVNRFYRPNVNAPASPSPQTQATPT